MASIFGGGRKKRRTARKKGAGFVQKVNKDGTAILKLSAEAVEAMKVKDGSVLTFSSNGRFTRVA